MVRLRLFRALLALSTVIAFVVSSGAGRKYG